MSFHLKGTHEVVTKGGGLTFSFFWSHLLFYTFLDGCIGTVYLFVYCEMIEENNAFLIEWMCKIQYRSYLFICTSGRQIKCKKEEK